MQLNVTVWALVPSKSFTMCTTYLWHSFNRLSPLLSLRMTLQHLSKSGRWHGKGQRLFDLSFNLSEGFNGAITCQSCCNFALLPIFSDYQIVVCFLLRFILLDLLGNERRWRQVALYFVDWMIRGRQWILWFMLIWFAKIRLKRDEKSVRSLYC